MLSDGNGAFYFGSLKPGPAYLTIDRATIGFDKTTSQPMPVELLIRGGEESNITLIVTKSVTVRGSVILFAFKEQNNLDTSTALEAMGGRSGVFLELTNGTEVHRRVSGAHGQFLFSELRHGPWVLKVTGGDIPEYHVVDPEVIDANLASGETKDVSIQIRPRKRAIIMLQEGSVVQELPSINQKKSPSPKGRGQNATRWLVFFDKDLDGYLLQISSWKTDAGARTAAAHWGRVTGRKTFVRSVRVPALGLYYRVYIGVFKTKDEAMAIYQTFQLK